MRQRDTLKSSMAAIKAVWGPLTTELVDSVRSHIQALTKASPEEAWLAELHRDQPASRELYRDPDEGFVLLAHFEDAKVYRPPHDHGRSWVVYAIQQGESEMGRYARIVDPEGQPRLVKRNTRLLRAGEAEAYLPGDIHDTRCVSGPALLFRFTERDLKAEDEIAKRLTRYQLRDGVWRTP